MNTYEKSVFLNAFLVVLWYHVLAIEVMKMKLIVGLGNPGKEYENTRHNSGFCVMDELAKECQVQIEQKKFKSLIATTRIHGEQVMLMKPQTYMNNSGEAVIEAVKFYHIDLEDILVIYDDMDMPIGKIRLREKGSAGGQNGVKSIIAHLHTQDFKRIRVGIGKDSRVPVVDWVLGKIRKEELKDYHQAVCMAKDAAIYSISHSFVDTMSHFNKK